MFAGALVTKHGRPLKLASSIANTEYFKRLNDDPQQAAADWCAERERERKAAAPAPKRSR